MKCKKCNLALQKDWRFCPLCGSSSQDLAFKEKKPASYGSGVRSQVFEVIVRQAIAGAPWRELCVGPMQVNSITPEEIEEEIRRRRGGSDGPPLAPVPKKPHPTQGAGSIGLALPMPSQQLLDARVLVLNLITDSGTDNADLQAKLNEILAELDSLLAALQAEEQATNRANSEAQLQQDLERENSRRRQDIKPADGWTPPHHL